MKPWMFLVLVVLLLVFTNPSYDAHSKKVAEKIGWDGRFLVSVFVGRLERHNWILFSLGTCGKDVVTVGILGQVFWVVSE